MSTIEMNRITEADALNDPDPLSFDTPARQSLTMRRNCKVCEKPAEIPILARGQLCNLCRADLGATARHIKETLATAESRFFNALDAWEAAYAQATPEDQQRYHVVEDARAANAPGFAAKYQKALGKGDGLSALLKAKEQCDAATEHVQGRLAAWGDAALEEVRMAQS